MTILRQARETRGWTSDQLNHAVRSEARRLGVPTASATSLRVQISRWENGQASPDDRYQSLLSTVLRLPRAALGFAEGAEVSDNGGISALVRRSPRRTAVGGNVLEYFQNQLAAHAELDNQAGPGLVIDSVKVQFAQIKSLLLNGSSEMAHLAARFAEHAGWLSQDSGENTEALKYTDEAVDLAESADDPTLTAYSVMRKSNVLSAIGDHRRALITANRATLAAERSAPEMLPVCLRQVALAAADLHLESESRAALERALTLLNEPASDHASYCTVSYLEMESAHCLLHLGNGALAKEACGRALASWPDTGSIRDESICLARLAIAELDQNNVEAACSAATRAAMLAARAPSARAILILRTLGRRVQPYRDATVVRELRETLTLVV